MKEIKAPAHWDLPTDREMPTPIGRLHIGEHICRWYYYVSKGETILVIPQEALDDRSVVVIKGAYSPSIPGFLPSLE